ncbi:major facilitator superfamily transporter [Myriangium duriaei CBS 260.36]|uniref:Molybdate-anion transporter n=1 Tax=Myriangium duriaei CBS 260.36 TaxID=1168546 RepID=A0A9P4J167_9PEZI|nr:major facilitator superfamily transporter [Myriangium duriaei CBS 260.36]
MSFYQGNLVCLLLVNAGLFWYQRRQKAASKATEDSENLLDEKDLKGSAAAAAGFFQNYAIAFLLASAGDWLQGPHIYAIYKYEKHLSEEKVAALYACGFIAAAVGSTFVGQIVDRGGRRLACLLYCGLYSICCLTMVSDSLPILFMGRIFGGLSTTLLFSAFDAWMIAEFQARDMEKHMSLASTFGYLSSLNCIVAVATGVIGELVVSYTGSRIGPFLLAVVFFATAALYMSSFWNENYGSGDVSSPMLSVKAITDAIAICWRDKRVLALTVSTSIFESMMYLFIFFWTASIQSARASGGQTQDPPFGIIFACFMCSMMAGSILFSFVSDADALSRASYLLKLIVGLAAIWLFSVVLTRREDVTFYAFCLLELCVGIYFPSSSFLKSHIIEDSCRGKIYSLMRLPLNTLVILAHSLAEEGDKHRNGVFLSFGGGLIFVLFVLQKYIV